MLQFGSCQRTQCVTVPIVNDDMLEETESFNVSLEGGRGVSSRFVFAPQEMSVTITDEDGMGSVDLYMISGFILFCPRILSFSDYFGIRKNSLHYLRI